MGESSFVSLFGVTLLVFLGINGPIKEDSEQFHVGEVSTSMVDGEAWTQVDFAEEELDYLRHNCRRRIPIKETGENNKTLLDRLRREQEKCKQGHEAINRLSEGQRRSLIELYRWLDNEVKQEQEKEESNDYRRDVYDYLDYLQLGISIDRLRYNEQLRRTKSESFSPELSLGGLRSPSSLARELYSLPQLKPAKSSP